MSGMGEGDCAQRKAPACAATLQERRDSGSLYWAQC